MLFAQVLIDVAHQGDVREIEARAIGIERRTPHASLRVDFAEPGKSEGALWLTACVLISNIGGRRAGLLEIMIIVASGDCRARIVKPSACILWSCRNDRREIFGCGLEILAREHLVGVLA